MIDTTSETIITPRDATQFVPRRRAGRKTHVSTIFRWMSVGVRGVVLESIQIGGSKCTSREALQRFFERLSGPVGTGPTGSHVVRNPVRRSVAQRQRQAAQAGRELAEMMGR